MMARFKFVDQEQLLDKLGIRYEHRGETLWASCPHPEHNDSSPSWRINIDTDSPKYGQHRCYGCGWGGWPVHLVESVLGCERKAATDWLKDIESDPPLPFTVEVDFQRNLNTAFQLPPGVEVEPFGEWPEVTRQYLLGRGIGAWQVERWGIGHAPGRYDKDTNPLAGRIVFSVRNVNGKLIGYTGRAYNGSERRYKEPSRKEGADLGAVFGEEHWPKRRKVVVVTEGAVDGLVIECLFPDLPIGGIYGSQLLPGHIARLSTFEHILMCTDSDNAGNTVATILSEELRRWTNVIRVELPKGEDAGNLAVNSPQVLRDAISTALHVTSGYRNREDVEGRPRACRRRTDLRAPRVRR